MKAKPEKGNAAVNGVEEQLKKEIEEQKKISAWHFERSNKAEAGKWRSAVDSANDTWKLEIIKLIAKGERDAAILALIDGPKMDVQFEVAYAGAAGAAPTTEKK